MLDKPTPNDRAIWGTAFYAGLRLGELRALDVENIELVEGVGDDAMSWGVIHVRENMDKVEGKVAPKSDAGKHDIPVPEQLHKILAPVIADRVGLAFGDSATRPFSRDVVVGRAEKVWREAGIDPAQFPNHDPDIHGEDQLRPHEALHSYKTYLEVTDIRDSRINRYMGHADHSVQARYSHQLDASYLDDAKTLTEYLRLAEAPSVHQLCISEHQSTAI
jgi:integrase